MPLRSLRRSLLKSLICFFVPLRVGKKLFFGGSLAYDVLAVHFDDMQTEKAGAAITDFDENGAVQDSEVSFNLEIVE